MAFIEDLFTAGMSREDAERIADEFENRKTDSPPDVL
jgi:hypothetical protein